MSEIRFTTLPRTFVVLLLLAGVSPGLAQTKTDPSPPNFIVILSDDQGWNGTSVRMMDDEPRSGSTYYRTPHTEKLAARGMRFSSGYAPAAVCSPTRYSIQYGQTPARLQMIRVGMNTAHIQHERMLSIPQMLKSIDANYRTAHFGKWHLDVKPEVLGYDESDGKSNNSTGGYSSGREKWSQFQTSDDPKKIFSITRSSSSFIERQAKAGRPFYLQVSHFAVHADLIMKQETLEKYQAIPPEEVHNNPGFAAMTEDLDAGVGLLLDKVRELGLEHNTYVVYLADNGSVPVIPPGTKYTKSLNYPLSRGKWDLMEGGIRVPFIVAGPGIAAGVESKVPVAGFDLLPTLADIAGYKSKLPASLDGGSFKDVLRNRGRGAVSRPIDALFFHNPSTSGQALNRPHSAVRQGPYKLVKFQDDGELWLFDVERDFAEQKNLAPAMPDKARELATLLDAYLASVRAPKWKKGINWESKLAELNSFH